ncbi:NADH:flavin oxidoreductase/NADH oxidase [Plantibacter sp. YIM 135347]|uniref:NADH:flavin oxidoreductase/NADH oxidase n=1 Tax=Plantibacter sp. YIM 135347 TaxID=3423919 RepID=UPI003D3255D8
MTTLFDPYRLRGIDIRNRLWVASMCQYAVEQEDGVPTAWQLVHLGQFAAGGFGLVLTEATAVNPEGRISPRDTGIWTDEQRDAWKPVTAFLSAHGAVPGIQLAHAGRRASSFAPWGTTQRGTIPADQGGWTTVGPSAVPFLAHGEPVALDAAGIDRVVEDFRSAAARAVEAGFRVIELHAAHGYLLHQFLSPLSNVRTDEYGGSLENRARLLLRVVDAVRSVLPEDLALFIRFSATDWAEGGWNEQQTATVAGWAVEHGADFFDISSGGIVGDAVIPYGPGYQVPLAASVRASGVPTSAVGEITTPEQAAAIIADEQADAVLLARQALRDPHFPLHAAEVLGADVDLWPGQYQRAKPDRVGS